MSQPTITGELRQWHHDLTKDNRKCVIGKMYNDTLDIWENGEEAVVRYKDFYESANFYLAITYGGGCIKCMKDEEVKDAPEKSNRS